MSSRLIRFNPLFIRSVFLFFYILNSFIFVKFKFQSLIHQVSVSFSEVIEKLKQGWNYKFQSLIHQVSVSFRTKLKILNMVWHYVSIPYSSGQCFFSGWGFNRAYLTEKFQSLIHQVSVSFTGTEYREVCDLCRFQSLIHQVSVSFMAKVMVHYEVCNTSFNPLFIRSVFLLQKKGLKPARDMFQSLIHQVSVSFSGETSPLRRSCG